MLAIERLDFHTTHAVTIVLDKDWPSYMTALTTQKHKSLYRKPSICKSQHNPLNF